MSYSVQMPEIISPTGKGPSAAQRESFAAVLEPAFTTALEAIFSKGRIAHDIENLPSGPI